MEALFHLSVTPHRSRLGADPSFRRAPCRDPIGLWLSDAMRGRTTPEQCGTEFAGNLTGNFAGPLAAWEVLVRGTRAPSTHDASRLLKAEGRA
jgi:hypothetical protein